MPEFTLSITFDYKTYGNQRFLSDLRIELHNVRIIVLYVILGININETKM